MDARSKLLAVLREHALVIGEVTLASGRTAQYYVDARRALLSADGFAALGELVVAEFALGRMRQWAVGPHTKALLVDCEQGRFLTPPEDWTVGARMAHGGSYGARRTGHGTVI